MTKEHVVSNSVLKILHPEGSVGIPNIYNRKILYNNEAMVKDVCNKCNNEKLISYDQAGKALTGFLESNLGNCPLAIPFGQFELGWVIKTHLNFFRVIKDRSSGKAYRVCQSLKNCISRHRKIKNSQLFFLVRILPFKKVDFDSKSKNQISTLNYNSKRILKEDIIYSRLQILQLDTIILLPIDGDYKKFSKRVENFVKNWRNNRKMQHQIDLDHYIFVDLEKLIKIKKLPFNSLTPKTITQKRFIPTLSNGENKLFRPM